MKIPKRQLIIFAIFILLLLLIGDFQKKDIDELRKDFSSEPEVQQIPLPDEFEPDSIKPSIEQIAPNNE